MTAFALRLANGQDTAARVRFGDALGLTPGAVPLAARSGLRPDGGGVVAVSAGTMDVTVTPFAAWIDGGTSDAQAGYPFFLDATATLTLAAGDATQARVDTIVAEVQDDAFDGSTLTQATLHVVQGTPGAGAPALPVTCIPLRDVNVPAGVSLGTGGLSAGNLGADRRKYVASLGGVLPVASAAERDALTVQPGAVVYRSDTDALEVRGASGWRTFSPQRDWTTYTPTLTGFAASSTQARYWVSGKMVAAAGQHTVSSVSGDMSVALPFAAASGYGSLAVGSWQAIDVGTARYGGVTALNATANVYFVINGSSGLVGVGKPHAWSSGDTFSWSVQYEMA